MGAEKTYTLKQFCQYSTKSLIQYNNFTLYDKGKTGCPIPSYNIMNDYIDDLKLTCATVVLDDEQFSKYYMKPRLLAYDIYGSQDLYFIILMINNMMSEKDFTEKTIKLFYVDSITQIMSSIYNANKDFVNEYNEETKNK